MRFKCQLCEGEMITLGEITTTSFKPVGEFFDFDGRIHDHNPNSSIGTFYCAKGHYWQVVFQQPCQSEKCTYGSKPVFLSLDKPNKPRYTPES